MLYISKQTEINSHGGHTDSINGSLHLFKVHACQLPASRGNVSNTCASCPLL